LTFTARNRTSINGYTNYIWNAHTNVTSCCHTTAYQI